MKTIQVKEIYRLFGKASMLVSEDATLEYVVALLGHERHLQGIFIIDSDQKYVGMVSRFDLLRWTRLQLYGETLGKNRPISDLIHLVSAKKAKEIETHNSNSFHVKENDTLQNALDLMIGYQEDIIPVIDSMGRVIGDLSLSELLAKVLEVGIQPQR